jgi:ABC-2 type transport system permease protein
MVLISNLTAIFRKEFQGYFASPLAYGIAGVFWLISGFFFTVVLLGPTGVIQSVAYQEQLGYSLPPTDVAYEFINAFFGIMASLILFIMPILSMGLYAEERKRGTLELLATSPLTNWIVAVGKLLGVMTFFVTLIVPMVICEAIAFSATSPPLRPAVPLLAHLALILLATAILSLGMFISSLTDSSILAAIITFALILFLWVIDLIANNVGGVIGGALGHLSLLKNYETLVRGVLDSSSILLFLSYIILGIFLTAQYIETLRFNRQ